MGQSRAQSSVVGVALLLGFTLLVVGATVTIGYGAISSSTDAVAVNQAENALSQFDSAASEVALGSSDARRVDLGGTDRGVRVSDAGRLSVRVTNLSTGTSETLVNESLGAVVFSRGDRHVAYQGGGVWRGGQVVSPPEVHYTDGTLTLPVVTVNGTVSGSDLLVRRDGDPVRVFPAGNYSNPFTGMRVNVTVSGPYYEGWATYFRERTDGTVSVDETERSTTLTLTNPSPETPVDAGVIATGARLTVAKDTSVDGYDSTSGPYTPGAARDGRVVVVGDVTFRKSVSVRGSVIAGSVTNPDNVDADELRSGTSVSAPSGAGVPARLAAIRDRNDDANTSSIQDGSLQPNASDVTTLTAGMYHVTSPILNDDETLVLDTSDGPVTLGIDGDLTSRPGKGSDPPTIRVVGDGRASVYVGGNVQLGKNTRVTVEGGRASGFWLYTRPDRSATLKKSVKFTGVLYGAGRTGGTGITVAKNTRIYGAIVGDVQSIKKSTAIHYDHALADTLVTPDAEPDHPASIAYLHVSVEHLNVTDARAG